MLRSVAASSSCALGFGILAIIGDLVLYLEQNFGLDLTSAYPVHYLPSEVRLYDVIFVAVLALLLSFIATLYPAYRALQVEPAQELKFE